MRKSWVRRVVLASLLSVLWQPSPAQFSGFPPMQGERLDGTVALDRALKKSTLTADGKPFHAVMEINSLVGPEYSGRVEVWWVNAGKYRVLATTPKFSQTKTVNGGHVQEKDEGDYLPRWLEDFVFALVDPLPMQKNFRGPGQVMVGEHMRSCLRRDDRPGGITDQMTWGMICFDGTEPRIESVLTFNFDVTFKDWRGFGKKQIARTYETDVLDYKPVVGRLTTLEEMKQPDETMFAIAAQTPQEQRIATAFVATAKAESLLEKAPVIEWPAVREGRTEGYMIVYARTDRTGQVRESAKHNSDQPGLESYGMEQALKYKFKPLIVDGVAEQMEMPLVLHFNSRLEDPLPVLSVEEMKKQTIACHVSLSPDAAKGTVVHFQVSVNEKGETAGIRVIGGGKPHDWIGAMEAMRKECQFMPYSVNGTVTYYKGNLDVTTP